MGLYKRGDIYWYRFVWNGELIRESTRQTNKRVAQQMEAAHRASLAKGEVGIRDKKREVTLGEFIESDVKPYVESRFADKTKTLEYYRAGLKLLGAYQPLQGCPLSAITADKVAGYVAKLRDSEHAVATINRRLEVLRRVLRLAVEWGRVDKLLPKVEMLPGENHRDRVLTPAEESRYLSAAQQIGDEILAAYERALTGIRARLRGEQPIEPEDPYLLRDVTTLLIGTGMRPDECYRLRWEHIRDGAIHVPCGKTSNARRVLPLTERAAALMEIRRVRASSEWVFPAPTSSGHMEKSTLKKQHARACRMAAVPPFTMYDLRHTCLTRWAAHMDPYTLAYLAGHSDFSTTRRYVHPQADTVRAALERVRTLVEGELTAGDLSGAGRNQRLNPPN
jgi:integrase